MTAADANNETHLVGNGWERRLSKLEEAKEEKEEEATDNIIRRRFNEIVNRRLITSEPVPAPAED
jgi:hypothetical protein